MKKSKSIAKNSSKKINKINATNDSDNELKRMMTIIIIVTAVVLIFYGITYLIKKNENKKPETNTETAIQYDEIIVGSMLNQKPNSYYVIALHENDVNASLYATYLSIYENKENALKYFSINLDKVFNKNYLSEDETSNIITDFTSLKFKEATLLKIDNGQISSYYEGKDAIAAHLEELIK